MESSSEEDVDSHLGLEKVHACLFFRHEHYISPRVETNPMSNNTKLFSMLALLNAYVPKSYLTMEECRVILGPPDPIHGGPPFEVRMKPFSKLIKVSGPKVCLIAPDIAMRSVELLAELNIPRSSIGWNCVVLLCGENGQLNTVQFVKDLLTKREMGQRGKEKFSLLIKDIVEHEKFGQAVWLLTQASDKFIDKHIFPQTLARLYYIRARFPNFKKAEEWAKEAIERAENNSYAADTLGQVHKNRLLKTAKQFNKVNEIADEAFKAFRDVEKKADKELDPEWREYDGSVNFSVSFNNRGHFGFIQVAKIISEKYGDLNPFKATLKSGVESKFEFFEWYLSYSQPGRITAEPDYFWRDIALCYKKYKSQDAGDSTTFPALLDCLNRGLFVSKERRAFISQVTEKTLEDFEQIRDELKAIYEENLDDVKVAERYILSNIILSNKEPHSPQYPLVGELQLILKKFLPTGVNNRHPEFYLLVLLLFWPEEQLQRGNQNDSEELQERNTDKDQLQDQVLQKADLNEEDTDKESEQPSPDFKCDPDLQQCVSFMEKAYDKVYSKYLRGRYLLPLFFLGKGSGLSRWIHKSRLDAEVELMVETELGSVPNRNKEKRRKINEMWKSGKAWNVPNIQNMLQPLQDGPFTMPLRRADDEVFVSVGENNLLAREVCECGVSAESPVRFYLGFNIRGPVIFRVGAPLNIFE